MNNLPCVGYSANTANAIVYSLLAGFIQYLINTDWVRSLLASYYRPANGLELTEEERLLVKNPFKIEIKTPDVISPCRKLTATGKLLKFALFSLIMFSVAMIMNQYDPASNRNCRTYTMRDFTKSLGFSSIGAVFYLLINWPMKPVWLNIFGYVNPGAVAQGNTEESQENCRKTSAFGWLILGLIMFLMLLIGYNLVNLIKMY